jgi:hypothetical protein
MRAARIRPAATAALAAVVLVCGLVDTPAAHAAITGSHITTPASPSFFIADEDASTQTFAISGTASGGSPASDKVDIRCYYASTSTTVASGVALHTDRSFSVPSADLNKLLDTTCRLRAVPAGSSPANLAPFSGPVIGVGDRQSARVGGGTNNGKVYDFHIDSQQTTAANEYSSVGEGDLYDAFLLDPAYFATTNTYASGHSLFTTALPTRSELQVDGANAYPPYQAEQINANAAGLPALSYTYSLDAHTGDLVIHVTEPLVRCPSTTFPPTATSCASFVLTGVTDVETITEDHGGHVSWITDVFTSTDGKPHAVDLLWDNGQHFYGASGDSSQVEYEFPGHAGFSTHLTGDSLALPALPGTILIRMHGAADGDTGTGQGAIVYDRPATAATFDFISNAFNEFTLHQSVTAPAAGTTRLRFAYVQDFQAANVASLAQAAMTAFLNTIAVSRTGAGKGTVTSVPGGVACGTTCSHGFPYGTSVTLTAVAAKNSRFSGWSGACTGTGACTITTDGNTTVGASFVLRPCIVPKLKGQTLKAAKNAIRKALCSVGKVREAASSNVKKGRVVSQKPKPGKRVQQRTRVALVVSKG